MYIILFYWTLQTDHFLLNAQNLVLPHTWINFTNFSKKTHHLILIKLCVNPDKCHDSLTTEEGNFTFLLFEVVKETVTLQIQCS